jgi:antitoxin component of MazEF toxin-antitoxin module
LGRVTGHEDKSRVSLQLEADKTGLKKRPSFVTYLAVLFAGAFLLLLISYLMELRDHAGEEETLPAITMEEKNSIIEENVKLKSENEEIRIRIARLEEKVAQLEQRIAEQLEREAGSEPSEPAEETGP